MYRFRLFGSILAIFLGGLLPLLPQYARAGGAATIKGWISDEGCASGRAKGGIFTGTNPECAKKCIASGAKTVLIVPDQKILLTVDNPAVARNDIGNFVEVSGSVDTKTKTVHIVNLKMLTKGVAMCDPAARKPTK